MRASPGSRADHIACVNASGRRFPERRLSIGGEKTIVMTDRVVLINPQGLHPTPRYARPLAPGSHPPPPYPPPPPPRRGSGGAVRGWLHWPRRAGAGSPWGGGRVGLAA